MAHKLDTTFTKYSLTEEEEKLGQTLTTNNINVLQNLRADYAEKRLNIRFDPINTVAFAQQEAELTGQIGILAYLIEMSQSISNIQTL
jgi:hypothetical protein